MSGRKTGRFLLVSHAGEAVSSSSSSSPGLDRTMFYKTKKKNRKCSGTISGTADGEVEGDDIFGLVCLCACF